MGTSVIHETPDGSFELHIDGQLRGRWRGKWEALEHFRFTLHELDRLTSENIRLRKAIEEAPSPECNQIQFDGCTVCAVAPEELQKLKSSIV